jgi:hypothetical protein
MAKRSRRDFAGSEGDRGRKRVPAYRAEVEPLFPDPKPYGWRIYRRGETAALMRASIGYATEAEAWNAVGSEVDRLARASKRLGMRRVAGSRVDDDELVGHGRSVTDTVRKEKAAPLPSKAASSHREEDTATAATTVHGAGR